MNEIPQNIAVIIDIEAARQAEEAQLNREREAVEYQERVEKGRKFLAAWIADQIKDAPDWIKPYFTRIHQSNFTDDAFAHLYGSGTSVTPDQDLIFEIPGLAPIVWNVRDQNFACFKAQRNYEVDEAVWADWRNAYLRAPTIPALLVRAKAEFITYEESVRHFELRKQKSYQMSVEREAKEIEEGKKIEAYQEQERNEDARLFEEIKSDPIALAMVKAYLSISRHHLHILSLLDSEE